MFVALQGDVMIGIKKTNVNTIVSFLMLCTNFTICFPALQGPQNEKIGSLSDFKEALWWAQKNVVHAKYKSAQVQPSFFNLPRTMKESLSFMNIPGLVEPINISQEDKDRRDSCTALCELIQSAQDDPTVQESPVLRQMLSDTINRIQQMQNNILRANTEDRLIQTVLECQKNSIKLELTSDVRDGAPPAFTSSYLKPKLEQAEKVIARLTDYINEPNDGLQLRLAREFCQRGQFLPLWLTQLVNKTVEAVALLDTYATNRQSREKSLHIAGALQTDVLRALGTTFFNKFIEPTKRVRDGAEKEFIEMLEKRLFIGPQALTVI
jgi:hypothetical protein